ncbi:MAG: phosphate signaling complex protein PhoU [Syntrophobacteraceae bacterium]
MSRESFDRELRHVQEQLIDLGAMVEHAVSQSVEALKNKDADAARQLIAADSEINEKRFAIESETLVLIARQQPMATDLRVLAAVLEIATELERIADYAKGIAKLAIELKDRPYTKPLIDIPKMAEKAADMLHRALIAFMARDVELARAIAAEDSVVDGLYQQIYRELMAYVIADPRNIEGASHLTWVAHNLERTADRVVNICERVIFTVTGELIELDRTEFIMDYPVNK